MLMSTVDDTLPSARASDRVYYATGVLLAADDFMVEQTYHRSRLARALAYLHGSGTVAGLRVEFRPAVAPSEANRTGREEELVVHPGLAIDRLGRLIEIPRAACIRLERWYQAQEVSDLVAGRRLPPYVGVNVEGVPEGGIVVGGQVVDIIVVDVSLRFVVCERGKTPAFAAGPFDALDAVAPSRLQDGFELKLIIRTEPEPPLPVNNWPNLGPLAPQDRLRVLQDQILRAWPRDDTNPDNPEPLAEYAPEEDVTAVFLARLVLPVRPGVPADARPVRQNSPVVVDNYRRLFAYTTRALARMHDL
jgi:hypothetical protein